MRATMTDATPRLRTCRRCNATVRRLWLHRIRRHFPWRIVATAITRSKL